jgi:hypothetical protein
MSSSQPHNDKSPARTREGFPTGEQKMKLNYKFAKYVIISFLNSKADYVQPFLKPVDSEADGASDYYTVIKTPMDLSTMLQELEDGEYRQVSDVEDSFDRMFKNCAKYHPSSEPAYLRGQHFKGAFCKIWDAKDDWIEERAARSHGSSDEDVADGGIEGMLRDAFNEDIRDYAKGSYKDSQEDHESSEDNFPVVRRRRHIHIEDDSTNDYISEDDFPVVRRRRYIHVEGDSTKDDISDDDRPKDVNNLESKTSEDASPRMRTRQRRVLSEDNSTKDDTPTIPEHKRKAKKKGGSKRRPAIVDSASDLNTNHKKPLDTTASLDQTPSCLETVQ